MEERDLNAAIPEVFEHERESFLQCPVQLWLVDCANDPKALRAGDLTDAFRCADETLARTAVKWSWTGFSWRGRVKRQKDGTYAKALRTDLPNFFRIWPPGQMPEDERRAWRRFDEEYRVALPAVATMREWVRWLWILCDGLRRTPVRVVSGAHEPRFVTRHIVHPAQTQQDALNEFAAKLVNPPQRFVAHVRSPGGYHQVKLVPPVQGSEDPAQLQQVRLRSQQRYPCPEDIREGPTPGERPDSQGPPVIERRPRTKPPDDVPTDNEDTA